MAKRMAIVVGLALFLGAVLLTFLPTSSQGTKCGHWFSPEWSRAESQKLAERYSDLAEDAAELPDDDGIGSDAIASAYSIASTYRRCDDALSTRRNLSIGMLAGAVLLPGAILFVARREDQTATA